MPINAYLTLAIILIALVLLVRSRIPAAAIFFGALATAMTLKLAPAEALLKGFSNRGTLTVGVLYIVAAGMYSTGAINMLMDRLMGKPKSVSGAQFKMLPPIALGSAFLNNTPLVAMMIPVIRDISRTYRLTARHLLIPLSFASILGGICTLIGTSSNLIIAGLVEASRAADPAGGLRSIAMFDTAWVGVPAALIGIPFMIVAGRFLLPGDYKKVADRPLKRLYRAEFRIRRETCLEGCTLEETGLGHLDGVELLSISRGTDAIDVDQADLLLEAGDRVTFATDLASLSELWRHPGLTPFISGNPMTTARHTHQLVNATISRRNAAIGWKIADLAPPVIDYRVKLVALSRRAEPPDMPLMDLHLEAGDNLVLEVNDAFFYESRLDMDFSVTKPLEGYRLQRNNRAVIAALITLAMIVSAATGWMSMLNAGMLACGAMLLTGCLSLQTAARSIEWGTLVVIACAVGLESAITASGLADQIAHLLTLAGGNSPMLALTTIFLGGTLITNIITNNAAAAFMYPIAYATARELGVSFLPFAIVLMVAASCAFILPTGYQTNMMVWAAGGYRFTDFIKLGVAITVILGVVTLTIAPIVFPF
ncbi:MAG: SLC13 family permease [Desulfobacterales bacterium]|nr:SLC13 family permease [Desulfobacterales bacterium]